MTPSLIFSGTPTTRAPTQYGTTSGWYHVVNDPNGINPIQVAATQATLVAGGGDRLDPGDTADLLGQPGVWVQPLQNGGLASFTIELRNQVTYLWRTGAIALPTAKVGLFSLTPNQWQNFTGGIQALLSYKLRAEGGTIWWGSHIIPTYPGGLPRPPSDPDPTAGASWPLHDGHETELLPGNQNLSVWTYDVGVKLRMLKFCRDYDFTP